MANFKHMDVFQGRVGKINPLKELANGNCVINFSIAETPRKKVNDEWVDGETVWTDVDLWGDEARAFDKSDITPGTVVVVVGTRSARSYETDNGRRVVQSVNADAVAVSITRWAFIEKVGKLSTGNSNYQNNTPTAAPAQPAAAPAQPAVDTFDQTVEEPVLDVAADDTVSDDLFGDDLFGGDDMDDLFGL